MADDARAGGSLDVIVAGAHRTLPLSGIREVLRMRTLARPPFSPPSLLGVANLRGAVLPVVSAARLIGHEGAEPTAASRILVLDRDAPCGLLVDRLGGADGPGEPFPCEVLIAAAFPPATMVLDAAAGLHRAAQPREPAQQAQERWAELAVLGFAVGGQDYALPLDDIDAVLADAGSLTTVADSDPVVAGLVAHRGGVLPVIALARLLGLPRPAQAGPMQAGPIVVARLPGGPVGLVVDALRGIGRLRHDRLDAPPAVLTRGTGETRIDRIGRRDDGTLVAILAANKLFDAATQDRLARLAVREASSADDGAEREEDERFLAFGVGRQRFAVPAAAVGGVMRRPERLAALPGLPNFVLGAMMVRGRPLPLLDGGERLGAAPARRDGSVVLLERGEARIALAVDAVVGLIDVAADAIAAMPGFRRSPLSTGRNIVTRVANHRDASVFILDPDALLDEAERACVDGRGEPENPATLDQAPHR